MEVIEFLRQLGVTGFDNDVGPDVKRAEWENDLLDNLHNNPNNKPVLFDADDDAVHIEIHNKRVKQPSFMSLPLECQQAYFMHVQAHEQSASMKQQAQMMQQMAMQGPPPGGQAPQAMSPSHMGQPPKAVKEALHADVLSPAPLGGSA